MSGQFWIPSKSLEASDEFRLLKDLLFVDYEEMSPREKSWIDHASEHGEVYPGTMELDGKFLTLRTDLGDPDFIVELKVNAKIPALSAVLALRDVVERMIG